MKSTASAILFSLCLLAGPAGAQQQPLPQVDQWHLQHHPFDDPALPAEQRITNLLSLMTVDEKIACLGTSTGVPRLGVPNIGSSEGIHGVVQRDARPGQPPFTTTQFPQPPGMGATWDPALIQKAADVEGYDARFITQTAKYNRQILMLWGPQSESWPRPALGPQRRGLRRRSVLQRLHGGRFYPWFAGRQPEVLAERRPAQALSGERERKRPQRLLLQL